MNSREEEPGISASYQKELEALIMDPDLEALEAQLGPFNIFEAIGMETQEIRHSNFLAFLLDPSQNHGLGDTFLKRFLQRALVDASNTLIPITPIDVDLWSFDQMIVQREPLNIDILLVDEANELAVIIENKIGTGEHSGQLSRYYDSVRRHYPGCRKIIGLYLTPKGEIPFDETDKRRYLTMNYGQVHTLLEDLIKSRNSVLGPDVSVTIRHYIQLLRRHVVGDPDIDALCRRIYQAHKRALDLIYKYRPDLQKTIQELLIDLIQEQESPSLIRYPPTESLILFMPKEWDVPTLKGERDSTYSDRVLLFQFQFRNEPTKKLELMLYIRPGPELVRKQLLNMALKQSPFKIPNQALKAKSWTQIYKLSFLTPKDYEDAIDEEVKEKIKKCWADFVAHDLQTISAAVNAEGWIWESHNTIAQNS